MNAESVPGWLCIISLNWCTW